MRMPGKLSLCAKMSEWVNYAYGPRPRRFVNPSFARWDSGVFPRAGTLACFSGRLLYSILRYCAVLMQRSSQEDADGGARAPSAPPPLGMLLRVGTVHTYRTTT